MSIQPPVESFASLLPFWLAPPHLTLALAFTSFFLCLFLGWKGSLLTPRTSPC